MGIAGVYSFDAGLLAGASCGVVRSVIIHYIGVSIYTRRLGINRPAMFFSPLLSAIIFTSKALDRSSLVTRATYELL